MKWKNRVGLEYALEVAEDPSATVISIVNVPNRAITVYYPIRRVTEGVRRWRDGNYIQDALGFLNSDEREFLLTGMMPAEWDEATKEFV